MSGQWLHWISDVPFLCVCTDKKSVFLFTGALLSARGRVDIDNGWVVTLLFVTLVCTHTGCTVLAWLLLGGAAETFYTMRV